MIKIFQYISMILIAVSLAGCADEIEMMPGSEDTDSELPVEFTFEWPGITETRGFDDANVKTKFSDGDLIHVVGTFRTEALQDDGTHKEGITARYGALRYDSKTRQWEAEPGNKLTWPSISTEGKFYAYYISSSTGMFTLEEDPVTISLSSVTPESDPLMVPETKYMKYGHAVNLQFEHICSYLTLIDLEPMVASHYFFTTNSVGDLKGGTKAFNNAFQLTLVKNDGSENMDLEGTPKLEFKFLTTEDPEYDGMIYISGNAATFSEPEPDGEPKNVTKVGYFLEPGRYDKFELRYPAVAPATYKYLTYDYDDVPPNVGGIEYTNIPPDLEAGKTYTLTVTKAPGITIDILPEGDGWDEDGESAAIDVADFLKSIRDGNEYINEEGTPILEAVPGGTKLLKNVDFQGKNYEEFDKELGFLPDVLQGKTFDGNHHYISNLGCPLFRYNYGNITNLGIKNVNFTAESLEYSYNEGDNTQDRSRHGALCMWNRSDGYINNVRISGVNMTINVKYNNDEDDGNEVHNVGGVVGSNTGRVSEIYLGGKYDITVKSNDVNNAEVLIGGVAGQNAGGGSLSNVSILDDKFAMTITNNCIGNLGMYSVGGIVGSSSGVVSDVILSNVSINSKNSRGVVSYIGGMAGKLDVTGTYGSMSTCIVSGTATAGTTMQYEYMPGQSYIGGMVGYDNNVGVTGCRAAVSVTGSDVVNNGVTYGTGGAFGRIQSPSDFQNLIAYGAKLVAPKGDSNEGLNYVGNFAGIGPFGQTWADDYADKNLIFHSFENLPEIGDFLK